MENLNNTNSVNEFDFSVEDSQPQINKDEVFVSQKESPKQPYVSSQVQPQIPGDSAPFIVLCGPPASVRVWC